MGVWERIWNVEWRRGGSTCGRGWLRKQSETLRIRPHLLLVILQPFLELLTSPLALCFSTSERRDFRHGFFTCSLWSSRFRQHWMIFIASQANCKDEEWYTLCRFFGSLIRQQEESLDCHGHPLQSKYCYCSRDTPKFVIEIRTMRTFQVWSLSHTTEDPKTTMWVCCTLAKLGLFTMWSISSWTASFGSSGEQ